MAPTFKRKFNWRSFVSLYMTFSGIIIAVSGVIIFIAPAGRIANWTRIPILGLEKYQWQALHVIFTFLLVIVTGIHIYYNWKPLMAYLKTRIRKKIQLRKELWVSAILTLALFTLILAEVPPFTTILDFGEGVKDSWSTQQIGPPVSHAEDLTIAQLAKAVNRSANDLLSNMAANGINAQKDQLVKEVAEHNNTTPSTIYKQMNLQQNISDNTSLQGKGYGRKTLEEICLQLSMDIEEVLERLQKVGIIAHKNESIKNLATDNDMRPMDLVNIITGVE